MNRTITRRIVAVGAALAVLAPLAACSTIVEPEKIVLQYSGGSMDGSKFQECIQPSTKGPGVVNDKNIVLPVSLRTWNIAPSGGDSNQPIKSGTLPRKVVGSEADQFGPEVQVWVKTEFYLNTDCGKKKDDTFTDANAPLVQWWERTGRRFSADTDDGWTKMLQNTLVPAQAKAVKMAARSFDADAVDTGANNTWTKMEQMMAGSFLKELNAANGGDNYFCGPQMRRNADGTMATVSWQETQPNPAKPGAFIDVEKTGTCPPVRISVIDASLSNPAIQTAKEQAYIEGLNKQANKTKADSQAEVAGIIKDAGPAAAEIQRQQNQLLIEQERTKQVEMCAKAGANCTVVNGAAGVNVGTK